MLGAWALVPVGEGSMHIRTTIVAAVASLSFTGTGFAQVTFEFTNSGSALGDSRSYSVALGDLDGDGDIDAMVANEGNQPNTVWTNDGTGTFTDSGQALGNSDSYSVALGDLDGDGDLDAMVANDSQPNTVWTNVVQGACCVDGTCIQLQVDICETLGATYFGGNCSDTNCPEPTATGACCVSGGCSIVTEDQCTGFGGTWTEGGVCADCPASCAGDTNGDGVIDIYDLLNMLSGWGVCP